MTIFEKIIAREIPAHIIWENSDYIAFLDIKPINPGHVLLVPKKPVGDILDMTDQEYSSLFLAAKQLALVLRAATGAKRIGYMVEGFGVNHVHIHLIPINAVNELDHTRAHEVSEEELEEMAEKIRECVEE
jgi:histidine triad (HIT) family protein